MDMGIIKHTWPEHNWRDLVGRSIYKWRSLQGANPNSQQSNAVQHIDTVMGGAIGIYSTTAAVPLLSKVRQNKILLYQVSVKIL